MEIWINPACSKCRSAVNILDEEGAEYTVRRYLDDPPSADELRAVTLRAVGGDLGRGCFGVVERFAANSTSPSRPAPTLIPPRRAHDGPRTPPDAFECGHDTARVVMVWAGHPTRI